MLYNPEYSIEIIVLIKSDEKYSWYLSDKSLWILDYTKWVNLFSNESTIEEPRRQKFTILNKENWLEYEETIRDIKVTRDELSQLILNNVPIRTWEETAELFPSLYIDFDSNILLSVFPETLAFEKYVPDGWTGAYEDFYELIPTSEKYWIINEINYFPKE